MNATMHKRQNWGLKLGPQDRDFGTMVSMMKYARILESMMEYASLMVTDESEIQDVNPQKVQHPPTASTTE